MNDELSKILELLFKEISEDDLAVFMTLPSQQDYRSYYIMVLKPISLTTVKNRINKKKYKSFYEFYVDIKLLVQNALMFNLDGSEISMNAIKILNTIKKLLMDSEIVKRKIEEYEKEIERKEEEEKQQKQKEDKNHDDNKEKNASNEMEEEDEYKDDETFEL